MGLGGGSKAAAAQPAPAPRGFSLCTPRTFRHLEHQRVPGAYSQGPLTFETRPPMPRRREQVPP